MTEKENLGGYEHVKQDLPESKTKSNPQFAEPQSMRNQTNLPISISKLKLWRSYDYNSKVTLFSHIILN